MNDTINELVSLLERKQYPQVYEYIKKAQKIPLVNAKMGYDIADCFFHLKQYNELASLVQQLHQKNPNDPNLFSLYILLSLRDDIDNIQAKLKYLKTAIKLKPEDFTAYYNIGCLLKAKHRYKMAKKFFHFALERAPKEAKIYLNLGLIAEVEESDKEKGYYQKAISLQPDLVEAHLNLGMFYLNEQNYQQGWLEYAWRLKMTGFKNLSKIYTKPCWQGEDLSNKTLLIVCEQGYGDAIQFIRYLPMIKKGNGQIILRCRKELYTLLKTVNNIDQCMMIEEDLPLYDYYCPLLSLPAVFGTDKKTIPCDVPYLLVDEQRQQQWDSYFSQFKTTFNIGISWSGNIHNEINYYRKTTPAIFAQLSTLPNVKLFCLQRDAPRALCEQYHFEYIDDRIHDFADTAACLSKLDLTISVDTALVHLAGALNLPVWVLMAKIHDWRWQDEIVDNPWYPSLKLYRQNKLCCWQSAFDKIVADLKLILLKSKDSLQ